MREGTALSGWRGVKWAVATVAIAFAASSLIWLGLMAVMETQYPVMVVESNSMYPTLKVGDLILVHGVKDPCDIRIGDIIVFRKPINPGGKPVVHRVVKKVYSHGEWRFATKGDNNPDSLYWERDFSSEYIIGKVVYAIPLLGYVVLFMRTPLGATVTIMAMITVLVIGIKAAEEE